VIHVQQDEGMQVVTCGWGSIPIIQLDKAAKQKVPLLGGTPFSHADINPTEIHPQKKGFAFVKRAASKAADVLLSVNVKPFAKYTEQTAFMVSTLPRNCVV